VRLLVLGGTEFLGRALVEIALSEGDEVTLFNRGQTNPKLFPEARRLTGDRDGDLSALAGGRWDAVVDTSGYVPRVVRDSAELLRDRVGHYVFLSSISVYASFAEPVDEGSPVATLDEPGSEDVEAHYGALKALCEVAVQSAMDGRCANVRAGLIVGRYDPTGRLPYWVHRVAEADEVLVPEPMAQPIQIVDVRDLASWLLSVARDRVSGTFNATGPSTMQAVLESARRVSGSIARLTEVDATFLVDRGLTRWSHFPLWLGGAGAEFGHFFGADTTRALAAGLTFRPLEETIEDTLENASVVDGVGISREQEAALLEEWHGSG
jgi:2'-hydroxyisoflavone reductase